MIFERTQTRYVFNVRSVAFSKLGVLLQSTWDKPPLSRQAADRRNVGHVTFCDETAASRIGCNCLEQRAKAGYRNETNERGAPRLNRFKFRRRAER